MADCELQIPEHWLSEAELWRDVPFRWTKWSRPHEAWTHDHCRFCWACICDHRDLDRCNRPGPVEGGHYRTAFYGECPDGAHIWVCRTCFKQVRAAFGWAVVSLDRKASIADRRNTVNLKTKRQRRGSAVHSIFDMGSSPGSDLAKAKDAMIGKAFNALRKKRISKG